MKYIGFCLAIILLFSGAKAMAQDASFDVLCRTLPEYQPAQNVKGADYLPGVDVKGRLVAPADLGPQIPPMIDVVNIPVTIDLIQRFALSVPVGAELKPDVGAFSVYKDGRVTFNGQDLTRKAYSVCAKNAPPIQSQIQNLKAQPSTFDLPVEPKLAVPKDTEIK